MAWFTSVLVSVINSLIGSVATVAGFVLNLLPSSPFQWSLGALQPYVNTIDYFIPISAMIAEMPYFLAAVTTYYLFRVILRWVKAVD